MSDFLFAYGTLRPGRAPAEIASAANQMLPVGSGFIYGLLYDLGSCPGAVLDPSSKYRISGTIFRLPKDANILRQLDAYEEFDPDAPEQSPFIRILHPVALATGDTLQCWVYVYNGKPDACRVLASGRYWQTRPS